MVGQIVDKIMAHVMYVHEFFYHVLILPSENLLKQYKKSQFANNPNTLSFLYDCMVNIIYLLSLWKHHVKLLLQSFRSVSSDLHQC